MNLKSISSHAKSPSTFIGHNVNTPGNWADGPQMLSAFGMFFLILHLEVQRCSSFQGSVRSMLLLMFGVYGSLLGSQIPMNFASISLHFNLKNAGYFPNFPSLISILLRGKNMKPPCRSTNL